MDTFYYELWTEDGNECVREFTITASNLQEADEQAEKEKGPDESLCLTGFTKNT